LDTDFHGLDTDWTRIFTDILFALKKI